MFVLLFDWDAPVGALPATAPIGAPKLGIASRKNAAQIMLMAVAEPEEQSDERVSRIVVCLIGIRGLRTRRSTRWLR
jgi:hypothetical protein